MWNVEAKDPTQLRSRSFEVDIAYRHRLITCLKRTCKAIAQQSGADEASTLFRSPTGNGTSDGRLYPSGRWGVGDEMLFTRAPRICEMRCSNPYECYLQSQGVFGSLYCAKRVGFGGGEVNAQARERLPPVLFLEAVPQFTKRLIPSSCIKLPFRRTKKSLRLEIVVPASVVYGEPTDMAQDLSSRLAMSAASRVNAA